jgi:asparagine synthase (glutamine-hydrolysing)
VCGILAIVTHKGPVAPQRVEHGLDAIAHRGPDGSGIHIEPGGAGEVALAHRRLSIFDLSQAGAQPMHDVRGRKIVFNGSVFNWPEIRQELESHGYSFATQTDTEVILAAYDKWGPGCVTRFNGFWAFVLLDDGKRTGTPRLFISRDRFGIKPLYYSRQADATVFASEIGAISAYRGTAPRIDITELARQLVFQLGDDNDRTIYSGVQEFEPATNAFVDLASGEIKSWRYWTPSPENRFADDDEVVLDRFTELFEDAVRIRLRADREVALTLSGGIDSSAIAVAISRVSDVKVRAFTSHFPGMEDVDETRYAKIVAEKLGLEHVLVQPDIKNLALNERLLTRHQELMYGSFSLLISWYIVNEIQKSGVRIFLTGQGGDELFLGYERYYVPYLRHLLRTNPAAFPTQLAEIGRNSRLGMRGVIKFLLYFSNGWVRDQRYRRDARQVYSDALVSAARGRPADLPDRQFDLQQQEICGQQLRHLLRYDDRTAAAFGTEARPAFLDHRLAEFALSLDWRHKIRGGWTKYVIRRYLDRAGLPDIAWRRHKFGFAAPTLDWTNRLLQTQNLASPMAKRLLRPGLTLDSIPDRMRFPVYNLLSTASEMRWAD